MYFAFASIRPSSYSAARMMASSRVVLGGRWDLRSRSGLARAAAHAQRAADYLHGLQPQQGKREQAAA
jgi:hypothetical protein